MSDSFGLMELLIDKVTGFSETASAHGPFFFGVFLIVVSMIVMYKRDNRNMSIFYAVSGIVFMGLSTVSFMQSQSAEKIYAYKFTLTNLPIDADIQLKYSAPRMYRDDIVKSSTDSRVHVAILSNVTLEPSRKFSVQLFKPLYDINGQPTGHRQSIGNLVVPFNGQSVGIYKLQELDVQSASAEEDGDNSVALQFEFVEDVAQHSLSESGLLANLGSVLVGRAVAAEPRRTNVVSKLRPTTVSPLVVYYQKEADENVIGDIIAANKIQSVTKASRIADASNAIWVGIDVSTESIEAIAQSFIDQEIPIRHIGHFEDIDTKTNIIQIGTSQRNQEKDPITEEALAGFIAEHKELQEQLLQNKQMVVEEAKELDEDISRILKKQSK